jgi:glycosyltransferase involved in cell wall biosynthesis
MDDLNGGEFRNVLYFVWNYLEWGGAQMYFLAIMKSARRDWQIRVIIPRKSSPEILRFIEQLGLQCEFIDTWLDNRPAPGIAEKLKRQWRRVHAEITTFRYLLRYNVRNSVIHIEAAPWQSWILLRLLILRGAQVFVTVHNRLPPVAVWREKLWKSRLSFLSKQKGFHVFTANQDAKNYLLDRVPADFWPDVVVTYASINPDEIVRVLDSPLDRTLLEQHGIPVGNFVVVCVGQFIDRKGRWVFLEAAQKVLKQSADVSFFWITPQKPTTEELQRIGEFSLGENFQLVLSASLGDSHESLLNFLRFGDVFALASYVEGLPISLLEAMATGLPCITTNINGIPEAVIDGETGILIEPGDSDKLALAILRLKKEPALCKEMGRQARTSVLKKFDEREMARIAISEYEKSIS